MEEKNKKKKNHYFEIYISKVLKQVCEQSGITSNAKQQLNSFICYFAKHISKIITELTIFGKKKTISDKEVSNAISIILSGELLKNSIIEGEKAVSNFKNNNKRKNGSRQSKAEIIFPPSLTEKFLRLFGTSKIMITSLAPVFLAAVLEYITYEILDISSIYCKDNKRMRITVRDLEIIVRSDIELSELFDKIKISFLGGGVLPFIHHSLLNKKKKKRIIKSQHRFRPGTVAIRDIKKYQKLSSNLIFAKSSFEKIVRQIFEDNTKISKNVFIILQYFIEQYITKLLYNANFLAIHSNRVKLLSIDIAFISYLNGDTKNPYNSLSTESDILEIYNDTSDNINQFEINNSE